MGKPRERFSGVDDGAGLSVRRGAVFGGPQVARVRTCANVPVLTAAVISRFLAALAAVVAADGVAGRYVDGELANMGGHQLAKTKSRRQ